MTSQKLVMQTKQVQILTEFYGPALINTDHGEH